MCRLTVGSATLDLVLLLLAIEVGAHGAQVPVLVVGVEVIQRGHKRTILPGELAAWWDFRRSTEDQATLGRRCGCADAKAATFCENLPALGLFAGREGIEPTNHHAERILRGGVLWRKNAFGCPSEPGSRCTEQMLTVVQTLRL